MELRLDFVLRPGSNERALREALRCEPTLLANRVTPDITRTDGAHLGFGSEAASLATVVLNLAATVAPMVLALAIYDVLKNQVERLFVKGRRIAPTPAAIADALASPGAWLLDAFIAFGRVHRSNARELRALLQGGGLSAFIDEDLSVGREWARELPRLLAGARIVVYLLGSDLQGLSYLKSEIALGVKTRESHNNLLLPFVACAENEPMPALPYGLDIIQAARWIPGRESDVATLVVEAAKNGCTHGT